MKEFLHVNKEMFCTDLKKKKKVSFRICKIEGKGVYKGVNNAVWDLPVFTEITLKKQALSLEQFRETFPQECSSKKQHFCEQYSQENGIRDSRLPARGAIENEFMSKTKTNTKAHMN